MGRPRVLAAMRAVPRHAFVDPVSYDQAYGDFPIPTAGGKTISQPYAVASIDPRVRVRSRRIAAPTRGLKLRAWHTHES